MIFRIRLIPCSEILWILSYGAIFDDQNDDKLWKNGFIKDFLKNSSLDLPNFGNLDASDILLHVVEVSWSGKIWISSYGVIFDDSGMEKSAHFGFSQKPLERFC